MGGGGGCQNQEHSDYTKPVIKKRNRKENKLSYLCNHRMLSLPVNGSVYVIISLDEIQRHVARASPHANHSSERGSDLIW